MSDELEGHPVRLPSGNMVRLQRPDPLWWQEWKYEIDLFWGKVVPRGVASLDHSDSERVRTFMARLIGEILVDPPADGILEVPLADLRYMLEWVGDNRPLDGCPPQRVM